MKGMDMCLYGMMEYDSLKTEAGSRKPEDRSQKKEG